MIDQLRKDNNTFLNNMEQRRNKNLDDIKVLGYVFVNYIWSLFTLFSVNSGSRFGFRASRCDKNTLTSSATINMRAKGIGQRRFPGKRAKTIQFTKLATRCDIISNKPKHDQINILRPWILRSQNVLFENLSLATRTTFSFYGRSDNFRHVLLHV